MNLKDIIQSDSDRLFIVDRECRIIFTGETEDDDKPFIRIGNWIDMPVELIPLIENIIITDSIAGNPSHEQFNIDITNLSSNRYIGSENIVSRYLNFETLFGLDLKNASIVNIEKDIPELSREKNISDKNQFIGVFYRNGNFKTQMNRKEIFDLFEEEEKSTDSTLMHRKLQETAKGERYTGNGMVVLDHNPLFYRKNTFTSYLYPYNYYRDFYDLDIRPGSIKKIIFPSGNYINLTPFFKWLHNEQKNITIYSDRPEDIEVISNLYRKIKISNENFSGLSINEGEKQIIKNHEGTYNLSLTYPSADENELKIAYIKAKKGTEEILKNEYDALFIQYSVYEDTNLLFKSTSTPVAVIDDGNPNISRISSMENLIIRPGIQYEFIKTQSFEKALSLSGCSLELRDALTNINSEEILSIINTEIESGNSELQKKKNLFNINSLLRFYIFTTTDRDFSNKIRDIWQLITAKSDMKFITEMRSEIKINLLFYNKSIFQFISNIENPDGKSKNSFFFDSNYTLKKNPEPGIATSFEQRVDLDRKRLRMLLDLLIERKNPGIQNEKITELSDAISKRKKDYSDGSNISFFLTAGGETMNKHEDKSNPLTSFMNKTKKNISKENLNSDLSSKKKGHKKTDLAENNHDKDSQDKKKTIPKIVIPVSILLILIILAFMFIYEPDSVKKTDGTQKIDKPGTETYIRDWEYKKDEKNIVNKYGIKITDRDIYLYANNVAIKNGYKELTFNKFREMNPHWIYPSNIFIMLDGEKLVVRKGDTLWGLSEKKLTRMSIRFYTELEKIKKKVSIESDDIKKLEKYSFSNEHRKIIKTLRRKNETHKR